MTTDSKPTMIDDAIAAEREMTPGPWTAAESPYSCGGVVVYDVKAGDQTVAVCAAEDGDHAQDERNARGVAAIRNAWPELVRERDELRAELERAKAQICNLVSGRTIESDLLCQHHDADIAALAEVAELRAELERMREVLDEEMRSSDARAGKRAKDRDEFARLAAHLADAPGQMAVPSAPRCSCTHEAGDSHPCDAHPSCSECGESTARNVDECASHRQTSKATTDDGEG